MKKGKNKTSRFDINKSNTFSQESPLNYAMKKNSLMPPLVVGIKNHTINEKK